MEGDDDTPVQERLRDRAIEYAKAQCTDEDILAALLVEYCALGVKRSGLLKPHVVRRLWSVWRESRLLRHARTLGRVVAQQALLEVAETGEGHTKTLAAQRLLRRVDAIQGLGKAVDGARRELLDMEDTELLDVILQLAERVGGRDALAQRLLGSERR